MLDDPPLEKPISKYFSNYPKPEAEYQEIIQNPEIFHQKLLDFHVFYGTKFRIPTLGGSPLDLHRLFLEATSRGGIEKVIKDRRWKEVTGAFNFSSTITSASFVLRKYYLSLLYHFEQVYYFRKEEPSNPCPAISSAKRSALADTVDDETASDEFTESPDPEGGIFTGTIEEKLDFGYVVSVNFGGETLKGVLYHTHREAAANAPSSSLSAESPAHHRTKRKHQMVFRDPSHPKRNTKRKHQMAFRDPSHPKRNRSGYTFFFAEQYHRLRPLYYGQERAISKKIGQLWSRLTEAEKMVYQEKGFRDKERYKAEMSEYKTTQHVPASTS